MVKVVIYTTPICPYCVKAKKLFAKKGVEYTEIDVSSNPAARQEMLEKSGGRRTVPEIFINDNHIGGCDDLYTLEEAGVLDQMLGLKKN